MTAMLSWHVQNFAVITSLELRWDQNEIYIKSNLWEKIKIIGINGAPGSSQPGPLKQADWNVLLTINRNSANKTHSISTAETHANMAQYHMIQCQKLEKNIYRSGLQVTFELFHFRC